MEQWDSEAAIPLLAKPATAVGLRDRRVTRAVFRAVPAAGAILWFLMPVYAQDSVVAKINGVEIRQSEITLAAEEVSAAVPAALSNDEKRDYYIAYLADLVLMDKAAEQQGITASNDYKQRLEMARRKLSAQMLLQAAAAKASSAEELQKAYAEASKQIGKLDEVSARHIVVRTEQEARAVVQELNDGKDFAELAKAKSIAPDAKQQGDLGYITEDQLTPEFSTAVFKLSKGEISAPIRSDDGWHIVKIEDRRKKVIGSFDDVKESLREYSVRKAQSDLMTKLRSTAKAELLK
ncbi:peptidylprolyl isomerase [Bradyrhizobium sp. CAR08]